MDVEQPPEEEDQFLVAVARVWPDHTLVRLGVVRHVAGTEMPIYSCDQCNTLHWPDFDDEIYADRWAMWDPEEKRAANWNPRLGDQCPCLNLPRKLPLPDEQDQAVVAGLQQIAEETR